MADRAGKPTTADRPRRHGRGRPQKVAAPDFTVSIRPGSPALVVVDENAIPSPYWVPREPRLDRLGLLNDLKTGLPVAGAELSNPEPVLDREDQVMSFSDKQVRALSRGVPRRSVKSRMSNGKELTYIEGWYAMAQANRIFGFDGWDRETIETKCLLAREVRGVPSAVYSARVRVTVNADGRVVIRDGHGTGEAHGGSLGEVHDRALKAAETDATKRALATFGKAFGLALYSGVRRAETQRRRLSLNGGDTSPENVGGRPDARRAPQYGGLLQDGQYRGGSVADPSTARGRALKARIEKSALGLPEPERARDKHHLRFVASQPCLVCGASPSDPHHIRFAQPKALGLKVSDEFTVPLCRAHHRELHDNGNERAWWHDMGIDPLAVAKRLWEETHGGNGVDRDGDERAGSTQQSVAAQIPAAPKPDAHAADEASREEVTAKVAGQRVRSSVALSLLRPSLDRIGHSRRRDRVAGQVRRRPNCPKALGRHLQDAQTRRIRGWRKACQRPDRASRPAGRTVGPPLSLPVPRREDQAAYTSPIKTKARVRRAPNCNSHRRDRPGQPARCQATVAVAFRLRRPKNPKPAKPEANKGNAAGIGTGGGGGAQLILMSLQET